MYVKAFVINAALPCNMGVSQKNMLFSAFKILIFPKNKYNNKIQLHLNKHSIIIGVVYKSFKGDFLKEVQIFTDGSCKGNPGPGGWGAILRYKGVEKEISGGESNTTNNRMELSAVINALKMLKEPCKVELYTDSQYVANALTHGWAEKWKANGWMRNKKQKALNPKLWDELLSLCNIHDIEVHWVKGHAGHPENERCDRLAVAAAEKYI